MIKISALPTPNSHKKNEIKIPKKNMNKKIPTEKFKFM